MENVKISVIIPVYNVEKYLKKCLDSVINQTLYDIEIICVNDGSTDRCECILKAYEEKDSRIKVITQENRGLGAARNAGFDVASGKYIIFVDSDDFISEKACEEIYNHTEKYNSDIVFFDVSLYWDDFSPLGDFLDSKRYQRISEKGIITISEAPWLQENHSVWSRAYRKDFLLKNGLRNPEQRFGEDMLYTYMTSVYAKSITILPKKLYFYRQDRKDSLLSNERNNDEYKMMYLKSVSDTKKFLISSDMYGILKSVFLQSRIRWAYPRQLGTKSRKNFVEFFQTLSDLLEKEDFDIINDELYLNQFPFLKKYVYYLEKKKAMSFYIYVKIHSFIKKDYLNIVIRIPKTNHNIYIHRLHYFKKQENMYNRDMLNKIAEEINRTNMLLSAIIDEKCISKKDREGKNHD